MCCVTCLTFSEMARQTMSVSFFISDLFPNTLEPSCLRSIFPAGSTMDDPKVFTSWYKLKDLYLIFYFAECRCVWFINLVTYFIGIHVLLIRFKRFHQRLLPLLPILTKLYQHLFSQILYHLLTQLWSFSLLSFK